MRRFLLGTLGFLACLGFFLSPAASNAGKGDKWIALFNGKDLAGWDTWLGRPYKEKQAVGLNTELPLHFFR